MMNSLFCMCCYYCSVICPALSNNITKLIAFILLTLAQTLVPTFVILIGVKNSFFKSNQNPAEDVKTGYVICILIKIGIDFICFFTSHNKLVNDVKKEEKLCGFSNFITRLCDKCCMCW